jgi:hypothetical protein
MRYPTLVLICVLPLVACGTTTAGLLVSSLVGQERSRSQEPSHSEQVSRVSSLYLAGNGVDILYVDIANPCTRMEYGREVYCHNQAVLRTPWHQEVRSGSWQNAASFRVDWKNSGVDPLAEGAAELVASPWILESPGLGQRVVKPSPEEAARILELISDETDTQLDLVPAAVAPSLQVESFNLTREGLGPGRSARIVVQIANRGQGIAYRVIATTRSSIASLDRQQLSFGRIRPGQTKVRSLRVKIPASETAPDTMLVLALREGNGFVPNDVSRRFPIAPDRIASALHMQCAITGHAGPRPELNAGERLLLRCLVDNAEKVPARIELTTVRKGAAPVRSSEREVQGGGQIAFDVPLVLATDLAIDSTVEIAVTARDTVSSDTVQTTLVGVVRKPNACVSGRLTRDQYQAKIAELRAAVADGALTTEQLDRYDAELISCLQ